MSGGRGGGGEGGRGSCKGPRAHNMSRALIYRVNKKGNPTLAWHRALITRCMNVIFHNHKDQAFDC